MIGELVAAAIVGATLHRGLLRFRFVHAHWQRSQREQKFEESLRRARAEASSSGGFRVTDERDREVSALLAGAKAEAECAAFVACGFKPLADIVAETSDRPARAAIRVLVDDAGTTCVAIAVTVTSPKVVRVGLSSYAREVMYVTRRGPQSALAEPPFVNRQTFADRMSHAELIAKHRGMIGAASDLAVIRARDDLLAELTRVRATIAHWREAQPPDALLDADLRNVLGPAYARHGKRWALRLRDELPQAQALRRPFRG